MSSLVKMWKLRPPFDKEWERAFNGTGGEKKFYFLARVIQQRQQSGWGQFKAITNFMTVFATVECEFYASRDRWGRERSSDLHNVGGWCSATIKFSMYLFYDNELELCRFLSFFYLRINHER